MIRTTVARVLAAATLVVASVGVSTAASAASPARSSSTAPVTQRQIACSVIQAIANPLLNSGLPINTVVNIVFNRLGGIVPVGDIRACLGV